MLGGGELRLEPRKCDPRIHMGNCPIALQAGSCCLVHSWSEKRGGHAGAQSGSQALCYELEIVHALRYECALEMRFSNGVKYWRVTLPSVTILVVRVPAGRGGSHTHCNNVKKMEQTIYKDVRRFGES